MHLKTNVSSYELYSVLLACSVSGTPLCDSSFNITVNSLSNDLDRNDFLYQRHNKSHPSLVFEGWTLENTTPTPKRWFLACSHSFPVLIYRTFHSFITPLVVPLSSTSLSPMHVLSLSSAYKPVPSSGKKMTNSALLHSFLFMSHLDKLVLLI